MPMKAIPTLALAVLSAAGAHAQSRALVISCEDPVFAVEDRISGDDDFPSTHPIMRRAKPTLHQVSVVYPRDPSKAQ
jgi:hypothetical protein